MALLKLSLCCLKFFGMNHIYEVRPKWITDCYFENTDADIIVSSISSYRSRKKTCALALKKQVLICSKR